MDNHHIHVEYTIPSLGFITTQIYKPYASLCYNFLDKYDYIIYDSENEKTFAERLDNDPEVKLFAKLPGWFKIKTPIGNYNPDWAVMLDDGGKEKMYFVVETKGTIEYLGNRPSETNKIKCGKKHFEALGNDVKFTESNSYENFKKKIES